MVFIEQYSLIIAIGLIIFTIYLHGKAHFTFKRRLEIILITISTILIFASVIAPQFGLQFDLKDNLINGIYFIIATSLVSDFIYKKEGR